MRWHAAPSPTFFYPSYLLSFVIGRHPTQLPQTHLPSGKYLTNGIKLNKLHFCKADEQWSLIDLPDCIHDAVIYSSLRCACTGLFMWYSRTMILYWFDGEKFCRRDTSQHLPWSISSLGPVMLQQISAQAHTHKLTHAASGPALCKKKKIDKHFKKQIENTSEA